MIKSIVIEKEADYTERCLEWTEIVRAFPDYDIYSLPGYSMPFAIHGDGIPMLIYYESNDFKAFSVHMLRKIESTALIGDFYDISSPYGYGGWHIYGRHTASGLEELHNQFVDFLKTNNIICSFVRYTPLCRNYIYDNKLYDIVYCGKTIEMFLDTKEIIWKNITSKNRNTIRKAKNNNVSIGHAHNDLELLNKFKMMYDETMRRDNAESYYFFPSKFYEALNYFLSDNHEIFYALYEGQIIAMSIILFANDSIHYHLSCSIYEYRHLAPSNLLLYEVSKWGNDNGYKHFHLGGGLGGHQDQLYKFKAAFNRNSDCSFYIGKLLADKEAYDSLVKERCQNNPQFDIKSGYFPLYRV